MKKTLLLTLLLCFGLSSVNAKNGRRIYMKGSLRLTYSLRSLIEPIIIFQGEHGQSLQIKVNTNECINVKILDESESVIYDQDVINKHGEVMTIDSAIWEDGIYEIVLTNPENRSESKGIFTIM